MRVIIRESAYDDLERIHAWIEKDRPRSADSVIDRILESTEPARPVSVRRPYWQSTWNV